MPAQQRGVKCLNPELLQRSQNNKRGTLSFFTPPVLQDSVISPSGLFMVHFNSSGDSAASTDFVDSLLEEADRAFEFEIHALGYPQPAFSNNGRYHIYLLPIFSLQAFGYTAYYENGGHIDVSPSGLERKRSFIVMDTKFQDPVYNTKGFDAIRITIFHEFFHLIQFADFGYANNVTYFQEMSSVWMEIRSSPWIRDYLNYLPPYFSGIELRFDRQPGAGIYGEGIWMEYLQHTFGDNFIQNVWEYYRDVSSDPIIDFEHQLHLAGSSFCKEYMRFGTDLFFTGRRFAGPVPLQDARLFPVDLLTAHPINPGARQSLGGIPLSLQYFYSGFGQDTCVVTIARDTNREILGAGTLSIETEQQYAAQYDNAALFCDTMVCRGTVTNEIFPQPFVLHSSISDSVAILASAKSIAPVGVVLNIYSRSMKIVQHKEVPALRLDNRWFEYWDGKDDVGKTVPSGIYLYSMIVDGENLRGKIMVINKNP